MSVVLAPLATAAESSVGSVSVITENDAFSGTDRHYTGGFQIAWTRPPALAPGWVRAIAEWLPLFPDHGPLRVSYSIGQRSYTPSDLDDPTPAPDTRPYAGWLYGALGLMSEAGGQLNQAQIAIGVVGPLALAEEIQQATHAMLGSEKPAGWDTQLHNEPAILLSYQRSWRVMSLSFAGGFGFDVLPYLGGALGNVFTYASTGVTVRFGHDMTYDYGPPRIGTNLPGAGYFEPAISASGNRFSWYLFAGIEGRAVAHNIFLDGNTFEDSRSVDSEPFVGDLQLGVVFNIGDLSLAYTQVLRTREFEAQDEPDAFGVFSVSGRF